ncbi:OmpA family protein [Winogradskyella sp.]|uniref:OmpA family protein n=1 Tax=Winogradskyella sp. TaxID=1883156 RepID=UPI0025E342D6|nr:OmpA family protein [Winogradskyella sp.]
MKTMKLIRLCSVTLMLLFSAQAYSQSLGDVIKKESKKIADKIDGKKKKKKGKDSKVIVANENHKPIAGFIKGDIVFSDNFNNERVGEFPSKWTQMSGTMQNSKVVALEKKEGVVQFITSARMKPTFKTDDYLGNSFKIEGQFYFHGKGNEAYTLYLKDKNDAYATYSITIRGDGIVPAGSSHEYARMPHKLPYPGWRTVQLSFNNGTIKVLYEGFQLINIADYVKTIKKKIKHIKEYTNIEVSALSRSASPAMINYITIGHKGLPLYKKLVNEGRLVFHDILFDTDSYFIQPSSYPAVDRIVNMLKDNPDVSIKIEGHTDANGTRESNQTLSENRAKSVMHYIKNKGVDGSRLSTVGYGEEKPMAMEDNEEAYALNRRVEIVYTGN